MQIHLGHHFYGAGNLGDDFMLAGFLVGMREFAPQATFTACVPFPLEPLARRFPTIQWLGYEPSVRARAIAACDAWLGLGGSPFQHAQSRWFVDHLRADAALCEGARKPMYFLGIGIQQESELSDSEVRSVCGQARRVWTRDSASAAHLGRQIPGLAVEAGSDLAHLFFCRQPPPAAVPGRLTFVGNFDFARWPGLPAFLSAANSISATDRVWLAQESRELPGGERALYAALPEAERARWRLVLPEVAGASLGEVMKGWPSGEWLVTARFHSALAGAWAGSRVVVIGTNEKLRAAARELSCPVVSVDAGRDAIMAALNSAQPSTSMNPQAELAQAACAAFVRSVSSTTPNAHA